MIALLEHLERIVGGVSRVSLSVCKWVVITVLAVMTAIVVVSVFYRYVLNDALPWSEEMAKFFMVWLTFLAMPIGLSRGSHISIEALSGLLKGRMRHALQAIVYILVIWLLIVFLKESAFLTWNARIQRHTTIDFSILYVYIAMPIGCAVTLVVALQFLLNAIKGVFDPTRAVLVEHDYPVSE